MKAVDYSVPWGRPAEDVIARKREHLSARLNKQRLQNIKPMVDCSAPSVPKHLANRQKKKQLAVDRQHVIDLENSKLVEKMARILRGQGPKVCGDAPFRLTGSKNEPIRRKELEKIESENRAIAKRIRQQAPNYDHYKMADDYHVSTGYAKNISRAHKRDQRIERHQRYLMEKGGEDMGERGVMGSPGDATGMGSDSDAPNPYAMLIDANNMSTSMTKLQTASQVRRQVAKDKGYELQSALTSSRSTPAPASRNHSGPNGGNVTYGTYRMQMDHGGWQASRTTQLPELSLPPPAFSPGEAPSAL